MLSPDISKKSASRAGSAPGMLIAMTMRMIPVATPIAGADVNKQLLSTIPASPECSPYPSRVKQSVSVEEFSTQRARGGSKTTDDIFLHPSDAAKPRRKVSDMGDRFKFGGEFDLLKRRFRHASHQTRPRTLAVDDSFVLLDSSPLSPQADR